MTTRFDPPVTVKFPGRKNHTVFETADELIDWAKIQLDFWEPILNAQPNHVRQGIGRALNHQVWAAQELIKLSQTMKATEENSDDTRKTIETRLALYSETVLVDTVLLADSPEAVLVRERFRNDSIAGAALLAAMTSSPQTFSSAQIGPPALALYRGVFEAECYRRGIDSAEPHRIALDQLAEQLRIRITALDAEYSNLKTRISNVEHAAYEASGAQMKQHDELLGSRKEKLDGLERLYSEKLSLAAPVTYWSKKKTTHLFVALVSGLVFVLVVGCALRLLYVYHAEIVTLVDDKSPGTPWRTLVIFGVPAFLGIWFLRLVTRIFLNQISLISDAQERAALINTYLALLQNPQHLTEKDRVLVVGAIFRPTPGGSGDDAAPPSLFDALMQRISGK